MAAVHSVPRGGARVHRRIAAAPVGNRRVDEETIHLPYGRAAVSSATGNRSRRPARRGATATAAQLASGASRAACYAFMGAAGPGRTDPLPLGPNHGPYSRSA